MTSEEIAGLLFDYMTYRADKEDQGHTLTRQFHRDSIRKGTTKFFGVSID